jgi:S1-C subfamily serine protease
LKNGDIIVEVAGNRQAMSTAQFNLLIRLNYQSGDAVPVKIRRGGQTLSLQLPMP